jgi:hypothetical protein
MAACIPDGLCLCSKTWVLIVHNDFEGISNYERKGNDADVQNINRVFATRPNATIRELKKCGSQEILTTIREKLNILFDQPNGEIKVRIIKKKVLIIILDIVPEVFLLFILSHGEELGVILTDHRRDNGSFDSYTTIELFDSLNECDSIKKAPKLLFLGVSQNSSLFNIYRSTDKPLALPWSKRGISNE